MKKLHLALFFLMGSSVAYSQEINDVSYLKYASNADSLAISFEVQLTDSIAPDSILIQVINLATGQELLFSQLSVISNQSGLNSDTNAIFENGIIHVGNSYINNIEAYHAVLRLKSGSYWSNEFIIDFK